MSTAPNQASFSPNKAVHLILLPTSKGAEGELSHNVGEWMGTPRKEGEEAQAAVEEAEVGEAGRQHQAPKQEMWDSCCAEVRIPNYC